MTTIKLTPVKIQEPKGRTVGEVEASPEWEEAPSGFGPYASFEKPGEFIIGVYQGLVKDTGPNKRNFYRLNVDDKIVGVWGNPSLDQPMSAVPQGKLIRIVYLGNESTKRGQNPVKVYSVQINKK